MTPKLLFIYEMYLLFPLFVFSLKRRQSAILTRGLSIIIPFIITHCGIGEWTLWKIPSLHLCLSGMLSSYSSLMGRLMYDSFMNHGQVTSFGKHKWVLNFIGYILLDMNNISSYFQLVENLSATSCMQINQSFHHLVARWVTLLLQK